MSKPDAGGNEYSFQAYQDLMRLKRSGLGWEDIAIKMAERGHAMRPEQIRAIVIGPRHVNRKP